MSAPAGYPVTCLSMHCGRICCDGCRDRPALAAFYERRGESKKYESGQDHARALLARWAEEDQETAARLAKLAAQLSEEPTS